MLNPRHPKAFWLPGPGDEARKGTFMARFLHRIQALGMFSTLAFLPRALLKRTCHFQENCLAYMDVKNSNFSTPLNNLGLHSRFFYDDDIPENSDLEREILQKSSIATSEEMREILKCGDFCHALFRNDQVIRTSWFRCEKLPEFAQGKKEKNAFGYYALTQKGERGKGLHQWSVYKVQQKLKKDGFDKLFISTSYEEAVAQHCQHKMGFKVIGKLYGIRFFGRPYFWVRYRKPK